MSDTNPTQPLSDSTTPVASSEPLKDTNAGKKCIVCGYEGPESVCPKDKMLMEEKCSNCNRCKSDCICNFSVIQKSE